MKQGLLAMLKVNKSGFNTTTTSRMSPQDLSINPSLTTGRKAEQKKFLQNIQVFRSVAIICIVGIHCFRFFDAGIVQSNVNLVIFSLLYRSTFLFVFIAGYLFQYLSANFDAKIYWQKKFMNVVMPYLIVSIPIIIFRYITKNPPDIALEHFPDFLDLPLIAQMGYYYATGSHLIPFWFIPMIVLYYAIAPLLIRLDRDKRIYYFLPLFIVISLLHTRAELHETFRMFIHFFSIYLLGMFFSRYRDEIYAFTTRYKFALIAVTVPVLIVSIVFFYNPYNEQLIYFQKLLICWNFIYFSTYYSKYVSTKLDMLANMSFGIYFLHYYIIFVFQYLLERVTGSPNVNNSPVNLLLILFLVIILSMSMLWIIKKIAGKHSRMLVGY